MKNIIVCALLLALVPLAARAQDEGVKLQAANVDVSNTASLQRGAKFFVNYCMGCHSARYVRYNRVGQDLGLSDPQLESYLMFAGGKVTDTMMSAMPRADAIKWFSTAPPDLSLESRIRGNDWIYTYLKSFYLDPKSATGVNNTVFPHVAMPDVLWELQGTQRAVFNTVKNPDGSSYQVFDHFEQVTPGKMTPAEFDKSVRDITNFLAYMGDPVKLTSLTLGLRVIGFLVVFFIIAYLLKREIWKKVH
ncbi:MAG: cytochrome c1 [Gammaproteobacteria bacterium]|nr:cytochrome c1 [Gammaproteobacteria bacterium]MDE1887018.1 cytochrome c1 [Gammaproteobacteria bacterium]MDE2023947.1 cytochrome c1 [Gammaproteobacteria bacterium]MDE2140673.1 cytochrome c1 [Gammaproteobacteria bacterium]MDE2274179.1 cytochrome c1 [Gammaproteobacteria bacterium]